MGDSPAILFAFLERFAADRSSGTVRSLADYCAMFPDHEDVIAREHARLTDPDDGRDDPVMPDAVGSSIGPYRLLEELGRGGQGAVFLARDERLGRNVALKVLLAQDAVPLVARERFHREAIVASRLDHPGICTVYEAGEHRGVAYVAMRHVPGETLARHIDRWRASPLLDRREMCARLAPIEEAARALHAAHQAGVVHRDVKPGNIMITPEGRAVVLDFGLARDVDDTMASLTQSGDLHGTPAYMSPEQLATKRTAIDHRTDVYSLGVTLFESLTGQRPFDGSTREGLFRAILHDDPPRLRTLVRAAPRDLEIVLETALAKDRDHRYSTASAFADDLRAIQDSRPIAARRPSVISRAARFVVREPVKAALGIGLALALLAAAGSAGFLAAQSREIREGQKALRGQEIDRAVVAAFAGWQQPQSTRTLAALLAEDMDLDLVRVTMAIGYLERGRFDEVLKLCDHGSNADARGALSRLRERALLGLGRAADAATVLAPLDVAGREAGALEHFVVGALMEKQADKSPERLRDIARHFSLARLMAPRAEFAFHYRSTIALLAAQDEQGAVDGAAALTTLWPDSAFSWFALGTVRGRYGGAKLALEALERCVALAPSFPEAWLNVGIAHVMLRDYEAADDAYRRAVAGVDGDRDPWHVPALWGKVLYQVARYDAAVPVLEDALRANATLINEKKMLASSLRKCERAADAVPIARSILATDPNDADGSKLLRRALDESGARAEAIAECERRLGIVPDDAEAAADLQKFRDAAPTK